MEELSLMLKLLSSLIPDGTKKEIEIEGVKYSLNKEGDDIKIKASEIFNDSSTKDMVASYKENVEDLDDDIFIEATEELAKKMDISEFNDLLDLDSFNEEQASKVEEMISISSDVICSHLQQKIGDMIKLYEKF